MSSQIEIPNLSFQSLADQFVEQIRRGGNPSIESWARAYPAQADEIREEFPNLLILEQLKHSRHRKNPKSTVPKKICGCDIQDEIGRGGMGVVYRAYQRELERKVAIKVLFLNDSNRPHAIERFQLERRAMARLDHPNIVPVYDYGNDDKSAFLVMKFIDGASLDRFLDPNLKKEELQYFASLKNNWKKIAILGAEVASAIHHAHENGMIHRDIKPANLILDRKGKVWVTDFGLAKIKDSRLEISQTGDTIGTPRYMAPEQFRGISEQRTDVYSLGLSLYEIACGRRAWTNLDPSRIASQRSVLEVPSIQHVNPKVPKGLAEIIMKACSHRPEDRYQTANEFQIVLERFATGCAVGDRRSGSRSLFSIIRRASIRNKIIGTTVGIATMGICAFFVPHPKSNSVEHSQASLALQNDRSNPFKSTKGPTEQGHLAFEGNSNADNQSASEASDTIAFDGKVSGENKQVSESNSASPIKAKSDTTPSKPTPRQIADRVQDPRGATDPRRVDETYQMINEVRVDRQLVADSANLIKENLEADASQYGIATQEKKDLLVQVDRIRDNVASGDFTRDKFKKFVDTYKNSSLPTIQKVTVVERLIGRSGLTLKERTVGVNVLQALVALTSENRVSSRELENLFAPIDQSRTREGTYSMPDNRLRMWIQGANSMVKAHQGKPSNNVTGLADELKDIVDSSFESK